jgi:pimeloyl-ACP methyl ester carboxylesterase
VLALRFRRPFRRNLEDPHAPLSLDMERDSTTLLMAFGGMLGQLGMPPFEFFKATGDIPVKRLFVRDIHQSWYQRGIPGDGSTIDETAHALAELISRHGVRRLVTAGSSAGGYAALVFGTLLEADTVLSFGPQTVLDPDVLARWDDHRWDEQLYGLVSDGRLDTRWVDLGRSLPAVRRGDTRYEVYYDPTCEPDRLHAERLADVPGVSMHRLEAGGAHNIARAMRESGELERVLQGALVS